MDIGSDSEDLTRHLEDAYERNVQKQNLLFTNLLTDICDLEENQLNFVSSAIFNEKKSQALSKIVDDDSYSDEDDDDDAEELSVQTNHLNVAFNTHRLCHSLFRDIAHTCDITSSVKKKLEDPSIDPEDISDIITKSSDNLDENRAIIDVLNKVNEKKSNILDQRLQYRKLKDEIRSNWKKIDDDTIPAEPETESEEIKSLREKYTKNSSSLYLLISIAQGLFSTHTENWASNPKLFQILHMFEKYLAGSYHMEEIMKDIKDIKSQRDIGQPTLDSYAFKMRFH